MVGGLANDIGRLVVATAAIGWPGPVAVGDFDVVIGANLGEVAVDPAAAGSRIKSFPKMHIFRNIEISMAILKHIHLNND